MAEVIGDVIHGGAIVIRERAPQEGMYRYLPAETRRSHESALIEAARRACPWARGKLTVACGRASDHHHYLTVAVAVPDHVRAAACRERIEAAERTRCACGSLGSWDHSVSGTTGGAACVWAGCPNCSGSAVGRPIRAADLSWYERHAARASA